jgi:hypothetical protein
MRKSTLRIVLFLIPLSLISCNTEPDANSINTAIAQTQNAKPSASSTHTPTETNTPTITWTPTYTPTNTATITYTPTPDLRIITEEPREFLLEKEDLPKKAQYFLPNSQWISPHHNSEIISSWGSIEGREYIERTGRVDGWWVYYARGSDTVFAPQEIFHNIIKYESVEGAQITVNEYNLVTSNRNEEYEFVDRDLDFGDISIAMVAKETQSNGKQRVWYRVETAYRNYVSIIGAWGWEEDMDFVYVENIAKTAVEKLESAPLSNP